MDVLVVAGGSRTVIAKVGIVLIFAALYLTFRS